MLRSVLAKLGVGHNSRREFIFDLHAHFLAKDTAAAASVETEIKIGTDRPQALFAEVDREVNEQLLALLHRCKASVSGASDAGVSISRSNAGVNGASAGQGVFATEPLARGRVVALYPGSVYSPEELRNCGGTAEIDPTHDNEYIIFTNQGMLFDGRAAQPDTA